MRQHGAKTSRVLIVVNKDWYFLSHRLPLARALKSAGFEVLIVCGATGRQQEITEAGFEFVMVPFDRGSLNPIKGLKTFYALRDVYRRKRPDIVHHVGIKPYLIGSFACLKLRLNRPKIINTITGLGFLFSGRTWLARFLRAALLPLARLLEVRLRSNFIFFNSADKDYFTQAGLADLSRATVIAGSGVDTARFSKSLQDSRIGDFVPTVVFCSRLLRSKGLVELVAASKILRARFVAHRLLVAGERDTSNPESISGPQLQDWIDSGVIEYRGFVSDTAALYAESDIAALPSHGEGLPLFILEAMAARLPCVVSDSPGCAACVVAGETGFIVPVLDTDGLANSLEILIKDSHLRARFGANARARAVALYDERIIASQITLLYSKILTLNKMNYASGD